MEVEVEVALQSGADEARLNAVRDFSCQLARTLQARRTSALRRLTLERLLMADSCPGTGQTVKNATEYIVRLVDKSVAAVERRLLDNYLRDLAVFVAVRNRGGKQPETSGADVGFEHEDKYYVVSVVPSRRWIHIHPLPGLLAELKQAAACVRNAQAYPPVQPLLGYCYGKGRSRVADGCLVVHGQSFWYLVSSVKDFYMCVAEMCERALSGDDLFEAERANAINRFTREFVERFCDPSGAIDWKRLVEFNSRNYDLDQFLT